MGTLLRYRSEYCAAISMLEIALFVEDYAHRLFIGSLVERLAGARALPARLDWRSAVRGHGMVVREFGRYLRDLKQQQAAAPDLIVVATDANCKGRNEGLKEFRSLAAPVTTVFAIPDPQSNVGCCSTARRSGESSARDATRRT